MTPTLRQLARMERAVVIVEQPGRHRVAFLVHELETGIGECLTCGARVHMDNWPTSRCGAREGARYRWHKPTPRFRAAITRALAGRLRR